MFSFFLIFEMVKLKAIVRFELMTYRFAVKASQYGSVPYHFKMDNQQSITTIMFAYGYVCLTNELSFHFISCVDDHEQYLLKISNR